MLSRQRPTPPKSGNLYLNTTVIPGHAAPKRTQQARQAERTARYEQIMALQQQGMKSIEIAAFMGMAPRTVREWLDRGDIPYSGSRKPRARLIDPYQIYLRERWQQGCQKASTIGKRTETQKGIKGHHEQAIGTWRR